MTPLYYSPTTNALQKTLDAQLDLGHTAAITLNNTTGVQNKPGVMLIDRVDSNGNLKSSSDWEWVIFAGTSGSTVTTLTRGVGGSTDQDHAVGAIVEFVADVSWSNAITEALGNLVDVSNLSVDTTKIVTPTGTQTLTNKTLTSPVVDTSVSGTAVLDEDTMSSDSATKLATQQSIKAYVDASASSVATDGWTVAGTFTYASATTITVASGAAAIYAKGDKIKLTQTTVKYFYVTKVADTVLTVTGGSDYTVANAAITSPYYSHQASPIGFPNYFNYTPVLGANAGTPPAIGNGTIAGQFNISGNLLYVQIKIVFGSTSSYGSGGSFYTVSLPVAIGFSTSFGLSATYQDNSTWKDWLGHIAVATTVGSMYFHDQTGTGYVYATTPFTMSTNDIIAMSGTYII